MFFWSSPSIQRKLTCHISIHICSIRAQSKRNAAFSAKSRRHFLDAIQLRVIWHGVNTLNYELFSRDISWGYCSHYCKCCFLIYSDYFWLLLHSQQFNHLRLPCNFLNSWQPKGDWVASLLSTKITSSSSSSSSIIIINDIINLNVVETSSHLLFDSAVLLTFHWHWISRAKVIRASSSRDPSHFLPSHFSNHRALWSLQSSELLVIYLNCSCLLVVSRPLHQPLQQQLWELVHPDRPIWSNRLSMKRLNYMQVSRRETNTCAWRKKSNEYNV